MYICMYVCIYVCMMYVCTHERMYLCIARQQAGLRLLFPAGGTDFFLSKISKPTLGPTQPPT